MNAVKIIYPVAIIMTIIILSLFSPVSHSVLGSLIGNEELTNFKLLFQEESPELKKQIQSDIVALRKSKKSANITLNNISKARLEKELIQKRLKSKGYYFSKITASDTNEKNGSTKNSSKTKSIVYNIIKGPVYTIDKISYHSPVDISNVTHKADLKEGMPLLAENVLRIKNEIKSYLSNQSCLYKIDVQSKVVIAHKNRKAKITFTVQESPSVKVNSITITNNKNIKEDYLLKILTLKEGDCFNRKKIDTQRLNLIKTNLFTSINVHVSEPTEQKPNIDIVFEVRESLARTMAVGLGFDSDDGLGISLGWEHRNLLGRAEKLTVDTLYNRNNALIRSDLTIPNFRQKNQNISFFVDFSREQTDAFISNTGVLGSSVSRFFNRYANASIGIELAYSDVEDITGKSEFTLVSLPLTFDYDRRNDPLDPTKGWVVSTQLRPFWDIKDPTITFLQSALASSYYLTNKRSRYQPTLALRGAVGSITGANASNVPSNYRFFSGGGGSVRGYGFQSLSPQIDGVPVGGLSFIETSLEGRVRFGESWGAVAFIDGGTAFEASVPDFSEPLRWGVGVGMRFYTSFAPIRFDIATPIDRKENEDKIQIYISIGQAF